MLIRIDPDDPATATTLEACAAAVSELAARRLIAMVEPFISHRINGRIRNDLVPEAMIRAIAVASGLGNTSAYTWLKVPYVDDMERVMAASTLPALILGGEVAPDQSAVFGQLAQDPGAAHRAGIRGRTLAAVPAGRRRVRRGRHAVGLEMRVTAPGRPQPYPAVIRYGSTGGRAVRHLDLRRKRRAGPTAGCGWWSCRPVAGRTWTPAPDEVIVLPLTGAAEVECDGQRFSWPGGRTCSAGSPTSPTCRGTPGRRDQSPAAAGSRCRRPGLTRG